MGYRKNEEPCGHTCPKIDEIISFIKNCEFDDSDYQTEQELVDILESIRSDNSKLREWGNDLCKTRDGLQEELDDSEKKISDLEATVKELEKDITEKEEEIIDLEEQIESASIA